MVKLLKPKDKGKILKVAEIKKLFLQKHKDTKKRFLIRN